MVYDLKFVNLGITIYHMVNHIDLFGFRISFYGIIIAAGMVLCILLAAQDAEERGLGAEMVFDAAAYGILAGIAGARIYYVLFRWDDYKDDLLQIFNIRAGGLAIYGGVIGVILFLWFWSRKKKCNIFDLLDTVMLCFPLGQAIGRWGNFFNCEAFGRYTDSLFAMRIRKAIVNPIMIDADLEQHIILDNGTEYIQVHPTFLYESVWNLCLFFLLWKYRKKKKFKGEIFFLYLGGYGLGRVWIEGLRTDSLLIPGTGIAVSQLLAGVFVAVAAVAVMIGRRRAAAGKPANAELTQQAAQEEAATEPKEQVTQAEETAEPTQQAAQEEAATEPKEQVTQVEETAESVKPADGREEEPAPEPADAEPSEETAQKEAAAVPESAKTAEPASEPADKSTEEH